MYHLLCPKKHYTKTCVIIANDYANRTSNVAIFTTGRRYILIMAGAVLKAKHSLLGKDMLPVILNMTDQTLDVENFARLKKEHSLERVLHSKIFQVLGINENLDQMRRLVHFSIIHANLAGAPVRQTLVEPIASTSSSSMEKSVSDLASEKSQLKVDDALREVRVLASRPKLTQPHVLIAALENLVDVATKVGHKDSDFFSKALLACRRYDDEGDVCGLCMKLIGSAEDKKVASAVNEWAKWKKYNSHKDNSKFQNANINQPVPGMAPGFTWPFGSQGFPMSFPGYGMPQNGYPMYGNGFYGGPMFQGRQRFRKSYNANN
ncbi:hypothetical protein KUTeg_019001, partial [Tegillarca granosa]